MERFGRRYLVLVRVQVLLSVSIAHGNDYRGVQKKNFLCGLLWHGKYHVVLLLMFL